MSPAKRTPNRDSHANELEQLLSTAEDVQTGPDIYTNHIQITASIHHFIVDLYMVAPPVGKARPHARRIQRVFLPTTLAKGFSSALQEVISKFETETGIELIDTTKEIIHKTEITETDAS